MSRSRWALEVVVPVREVSASAMRLLALTASSLAALSLAGGSVTLVLVGSKGARDSAQAWLGGNAPALGVRQLDFIWADNWSVLAVSAHIITPYFVVLEPGGQFVWPDDVPLAAVAQGALCFEAPAADDHAQMAFWIGGNLAPLKLGKMRATALWHKGLCERARIMLNRMDDGRKVSRSSLNPWCAYLAANEERLAGVHCLVQA